MENKHEVNNIKLWLLIAFLADFKINLLNLFQF